MKKFAEKIAIAALPTPIYSASRLSSILGGPEILVKRDDMTGVAVSGNKVRKLEYCAAEAISEGAGVLITCGGPQSNHARATAAVAARLGLRSHLVLGGPPEKVPDGNLFLDRLFGAGTTFIPGAALLELAEAMEETAESYRREGVKPYIIPLGASDALGSLGYIDAIGEIKKQIGEMGITIDHIVFASGSGGTLAGIVAGCLVHGLECGVTGISVAFPSSWSDTKLEEVFSGLRERFIPDLPSPSGRYSVNADYIGEGYGKASPELIRFIREAASLEALLLDPTYSGKALFGLAGEIEKGTFKKGERVLFIHTGGTFGLFPYREQFASEF
ncbi:MAG: D-cysteine desulfhydrase family protein [Thermovirgaceae bacterium]|nr:D-cysteine desulfhydrase family protein [Thermovirgaceae bacterium]